MRRIEGESNASCHRKALPRRSKRQEAELAQATVKDMVAIAKIGDDAVSVAIEEVKLVIGATRSISQAFLTAQGFIKNLDITHWNSPPTGDAPACETPYILSPVLAHRLFQGNPT
jgi:hypothetical protein